jgi:hypothetical protein
MDLIDQALHAFTFITPALFMALILPLAGRWICGPLQTPLRYAVQVVILAVLATVVLLVGWWFTGADGSMLTYLSLVGVLGCVQWAMCAQGARG